VVGDRVTLIIDKNFDIYQIVSMQNGKAALKNLNPFYEGSIVRPIDWLRHADERETDK